MAKNLVIVESPAKAKTIEKYLGKDFIVKSSYGHIRDLVKGDSGVNKEMGYVPLYEVSADKKKVVSELKKEVKAADTVWLASDEDREGEAISWHLAEVLNLNKATTKRIVFNEITKTAILRAIENPRTINEDLVNAQQARRVLDRLVGFELSPVLWKKVRPQLSAGRVQSVAVRLIVEREKEIQVFNPKPDFRISGVFHTPENKAFKAVYELRPTKEQAALEELNKLKDAVFKVGQVEVKPAKRNPSAPFTTSTLQQEASRKLGYGVTKTMMLAQRLYENGHITYMRTDSTNLSSFAIDAASEVIKSEYGQNYIQTRQYATKNENAQEAHEAIRPTEFNVRFAGADDAQKKLYELIWKRAIASQMAAADIERTSVDIQNDKTPTLFKAKGEVIKFDGFLRVYLESTDDEDQDEEEGLLPKMSIADIVKRQSITALERYSRPAARYTEASLVKKLEELGIGRPSTYAPTIATVQTRGYVLKDPIEGVERNYQVLTLEGDDIAIETKSELVGAEKNKLYPSDIGRVVTDFLLEHFEQVMDYGFTALVEKEFDEIANGLKNWSEMIDAFYKPFHKEVEDTLENAERASGERFLGNDPASGKQVIVRIGRYGPMAQIGDSEDEDKKFASLLKTQNIDTISLHDALELFKLPRKLGLFEDTEIQVNIGRFGPFVMHNKKFVSIPKGEDPMEINFDRCVELILNKREADANKLIKSFAEDKDIEILNGRWGPYIKYKKQNVKIPKGVDAEQMSFEEIKKLIAETPEKPVRGKRK